MEPLLTLSSPRLKYNWPFHPLHFLTGGLYIASKTPLSSHACLLNALWPWWGKDHLTHLSIPAPWHIIAIEWSLHKKEAAVLELNSRSIQVCGLLFSLHYAACQKIVQNCFRLCPGQSHPYFEKLSPNNLDIREIRVSSLTVNYLINI